MIGMAGATEVGYQVIWRRRKHVALPANHPKSDI